MKVLIAMDSFKGSLSSLAAGEAVRAGLLRAMPKADAVVCPLADGGEGTAEALTAGLRGEMVSVEVTGPLGAPVVCRYGVAGNLAIVEMAGAAGLPQVPAEKRDPMATTTFGVGEVIRDAIARGCRRFVIGLGGSATNDGGAGMLQALGFDLLDENGAPIPRGAAGLARLRTIAADRVLPELRGCTFRAACDVENPLCGPLGCSAVFGPQKGASREDVTLLDGALRHVSSVIERALAEQVPAERNGDGGKVEAAVAESSSPGHRSRPDHRTRTPIADHPGAGAAGGIGMALLAVLHADFRPGIDLVIEQSGLDAAAQWADIVFTGEGSIDAQTMFGKTPVGVASVAKRHGKPVIAIAGHVGDGIECLHGRGIDAVFGAAPGAASLDELLRDARANVARTAEQVTRLMRIVRSH